MTKIKSRIDLTGQRFGRLVVLYPHIELQRWVCLCDCGNIAIVSRSNLRRGATRSCGCYRNEQQKIRNVTHGESKTRLYRAWVAMRARCTDKNRQSYRNYGGRGIAFCDEWNKYEPFRDWALGNGYRNDLTLDRINNNGNYEPQNCRWVDMKTQSRNTRFSRIWKGRCAKAWSEGLNISYCKIKHRLQKGIPLGEILETLAKEENKTELLDGLVKESA